MFKMSIDKQKSDADRKIGRIAASLKNSKSLMRSWGHKVARLAKRKAKAKSKGGNFWLSIADQTNLDPSSVTEDRAIVKCTHPVGGFKETGGVIKPKEKKALTIPISEEAKGKTYGEFIEGGTELFTINGKDPETKGIVGYSEGDEFKPLFALRTKVTQGADPWWPEDNEVSALGLQEATFWMDKQLGVR